MTARWRLRPGGRAITRARLFGTGLTPVSVYEVDEAEPADEAGHRPSDQLVLVAGADLVVELCAAGNAARDAGGVL